jgi:trans-aconitate 2-methyltransferase
MNSWKPDRYLRFSDERTRPAVDLASRIAIVAPGSVIDLGCGPGNSTQVDIWETEYHHVMESSSAIVEWIAAAGLRPFLEALDSEIKRKRFIELLSERVAEAYVVRNDGRVLFPFRRTFVIAYA